MKKILFAFSIVASMLFSCGKKDSGISGGGTTPIPTPTPTPTPTPVLDSTIWRAAWVTNVASDVLLSRANIRACVAKCKQAGINHIFMVTYNKSRTMYPSTVMQNLLGVRIDEVYGTRDPLREMIDEAKLVGIKVHAWFEYGFASVYSPTGAGGPIITAKPSWAAIDNTGALCKKNDFVWLNSFNPEVQNFLISLFKEVVTNYPDLDGVQGDDRLPAAPTSSGYDTYTRNLYASQNGGVQPPNSNSDGNWVTWRASILTSFLQRLRTEVKAIRPNILFSMSPSPYPFGYTEYLQDWPAWVRAGLVDKIVPQCYRYDASGYAAVVASQKSYIPTGVSLDIFIPGIILKNGSRTPPVLEDQVLRDMVQYNRTTGFKGEAFFFYEGISDKLPWFINTYPTIVR